MEPVNAIIFSSVLLSNRLEIDPEGEEEVIENAGPLGAVMAGCPSVSPSH